MSVGLCDVMGPRLLYTLPKCPYPLSQNLVGHVNSHLYILLLQGDSGGPFVCKVGETWRLVGVTSWSRAYCTPFPSVYTF